MRWFFSVEFYDMEAQIISSGHTEGFRERTLDLGLLRPHFHYRFPIVELQCVYVWLVLPASRCISVGWLHLKNTFDDYKAFKQIFQRLLSAHWTPLLVQVRPQWGGGYQSHLDIVPVGLSFLYGYSSYRGIIPISI